MLVAIGMDKLAREHVGSEERCPVEGLVRQSSGKGAPGQPGSWGGRGRGEEGARGKQGALGRAGHWGWIPIAFHTAETG